MPLHCDVRASRNLNDLDTGSAEPVDIAANVGTVYIGDGIVGRWVTDTNVVTIRVVWSPEVLKGV